MFNVGQTLVVLDDVTMSRNEYMILLQTIITKYWCQTRYVSTYVFLLHNF